MRYLKHLHIWQLTIVVCLLWVLPTINGCSCGISIVKSPTGSSDPSKNGGNNDPNGTNAGKNTQGESRYKVRGVAMIAFYPERKGKTDPQIDPGKGSMNGYLIVYDKPQQTVISAWGMENGECQYLREAYQENGSPAPYRGLDAGRSVFAKVEGVQKRFERKENSNQSPPHIMYNFPTEQQYQFPYGSSVRFWGEKGPEVPAFQIALKAPPRLDIIQPTITVQGLTLPKDKDFKFQWKSPKEMSYLALRINQNDDKKKETRTLFCRFANTGEATISKKHFKHFTANGSGINTHLFFLTTTYKLATIPSIPDPILSLVRATITTQISFQ